MPSVKAAGFSLSIEVALYKGFLIGGLGPGVLLRPPPCGHLASVLVVGKRSLIISEQIW